MDKEEQVVLTSKEQRQVLKRLLRYMLPHKKAVWIAFIIIVITTIADLLGPLVTKAIIDKYIKVNNIDLAGIAGYLAVYALIIVVFVIFKYLQAYHFQRLGYKVTEQLRLDLYTKLQELGMRYFDQTPSGSIVSRVTNDTDAIQDMLNNVLSVIISCVILLTGIMITMFLLDPILALMCLAFLPLAIYVIYLYQKYSTRFYQQAREKLSQLNTKLSESISGMTIIQDFNQQERLAEEFEQTNQEYYQASMQNMRLDGLLLAPIIQLLIAFALVSVFGFTGYQSFHGVVSTGLVVAFIDYIYKFFDPMIQIMERLAIYQQAIVAGSRVFAILDHEEVAPQQNINANQEISNAKIEFKNVSFSYDGKKEVLSDISFTVNPGETVALVGHTGSGKSSIINIMMRFYEFSQGEILIDNKSIREFPMQHLRDNMGLVLQEPFMYYGTIKDNVRLLNKDITDQQVIDACKFVQANQFVEQLDKQYDFQVIERGSSFSTGQKQLLAFARTIVTDPKILILDEATANIDTETEELIQNGLAKIRQGRTTIAIAHRLSTIKDANQILVLDKGRIIERGTHDSLLAKKGVYYAMYQLQQSEME